LLVPLPLVVGLFIRARYADHAKAWQPELVNVASWRWWSTWPRASRGTGARSCRCSGRGVIVIAIVIVIVAGVLGVLLGARSAEVRTTTGLVSVFHFASLGLIIIGSQLRGNPTYLGPAITFAPINFIVPLALAVEIGHRAGAKARAP
jgi:hypothetical protein